MAHLGQRQEDAAVSRVSQQLAMQTNKYVLALLPPCHASEGRNERTNGQEENGKVVHAIRPAETCYHGEERPKL